MIRPYEERQNHAHLADFEHLFHSISLNKIDSYRTVLYSKTINSNSIFNEVQPVVNRISFETLKKFELKNHPSYILNKNRLYLLFSGGVPDRNQPGTPSERVFGDLLSGFGPHVHSFSPIGGLAGVFGFPHSIHPPSLFKVKLIGDGH
jgi:hypothetical protein